MSASDGATPRPWMRLSGGYVTDTTAPDWSKHVICHPKREADAMLIVKCVNAHDPLVTALTQLLREVDEMTTRVGWAGNGGREMARAALAQVRP